MDIVKVKVKGSGEIIYVELKTNDFFSIDYLETKHQVYRRDEYGKLVPSALFIKRKDFTFNYDENGNMEYAKSNDKTKNTITNNIKYHTFDGILTESELDNMYKDGWELVSHAKSQTTFGYNYIFKKIN